MAIYYNINHNAFYDSDTGIAIPEGSIEISKRQHEIFLKAMNTRNMTLVLENNKLTLKSNKKPVTWDEIRVKRNRLLAACDYTQTQDWPGDKRAWAEYRQELRDLPQAYKDPNMIFWPKAPD